MALTITFPSESVCFAQNPIVIKARTSLSKPLLKIVMRVTGGVGTASGYEYTQEFKFSRVPDGVNTDMAFDAMSAAQTMLKYITRTPVTGTNKVSAFKLVFLKIWFYEEYIENGEIVPATAPNYTDVSTAQSIALTVMPGGLTDYERYAVVQNASLPVESFFNTGFFRFLTRKPDGEIIPLGETALWHYASNYGVTTVAVLNGTNVATGQTHSAYLPMAVSAKLTQEGTNTLLVRAQASSNLDTYAPGFYVADVGVQQYYCLQFLNGFGVLESVFCYPLESLSYEVETTEYKRVTDRTGTDIRRRMVHKSKAVGTLSLSSGFVNEEWADWFVNEVLTSEQVFIRIDGVFLPAVILADEEVVIRNRETPTLVHVPLTVKYAFDGSAKTTY